MIDQSISIIISCPEPKFFFGTFSRISGVVNLEIMTRGKEDEMADGNLC